MIMTLFRWQARILNKLYKTERYNTLSNLNLTSPDQINYSLFYQMTPGINPQQHAKVIDAANKLCRVNTRASDMQVQVAFLDQYMKSKTNTDVNVDQSSIQQSGNQSQLSNGNKFNVQHVVVYSTLSKCRIWPKVLKSGIGFVPTLINFYNSFTKQYSDWLDFKFDPVILSQKYTKIMKKAHMKKRDHPKLIQAIQQNNIQNINTILQQLKQQESKKNPLQPQQKQNDQQENGKVYTSILNNISHKGMAISHIAAQSSSLETIKYLHEMGADFELLDDEKQTSVFYAVKRADLSIVKYFVEVLKVNLNHRQYQDRTLLYLAAFQGELEIVDYLYKMGADPQLSSKLDRTPMSKACYLGNVKVVKYLLTLKVDILKQDNKGRTALHNAAWGIEGGRDGKRRGHIMLEDSPECAQLLLDAGHPIDFEDYDGFTPLFSAVSSCAVRSLRLLVSRGANLLHKTKNKQTAVFIGAKYGHLPVLKILIEQHKLDYTEPDYHGYSPLCATVTLDQAGSFCYFADLYFKDKRELGFQDFIRCCRQYETQSGMAFVKHWMNSQNSQISRQDKIIYLSRHLPEITKIVTSLKKQKRVLKSQLAELEQKYTAIRIKQQQHKTASLTNNQPKIQQTVEKQSMIIKKQSTNQQQPQQKVKVKQAQQTDTKQQLQQSSNKQKSMMAQTQRNNLLRAAQKQRQKQRQLTFYAIRDQNKKIDSIRKLISILVTTVADIIKGLQSYIKDQLHKSDMLYNESNMELMRRKLIEKYDGIQYKMSVLFILSECVHAFNKDKPSYIGNIVESMLELAKVINIDQPAIPPVFASSAAQDKQSKLLYQHLLDLAEQSSVQANQLCRLHLQHYQNQSQILKLLTNQSVLTNLTGTIQQVTDTMFRLAKLRFVGVIINIFSSHNIKIGCVGYEQLIQIISGKSQPQSQSQPQTETEVGQQQHKRLTLIQFCVLNNIADLAVYLQQLCKSHDLHNTHQLLVSIPAYSVTATELTEQQTSIQLDAVQPWVFDLQALITRMSQQESAIYRRFMDLDDGNQDRNIQMDMVEVNEEQEIRTVTGTRNGSRKQNSAKFQSCLTYKIVDSKPKLQQMRQSIKKSVLIGIDVEHYNVSKQQCFVCSIQVSCGQCVFIIDTLSHLSSQSSSTQTQQAIMMPYDIAVFMRELMQDQTKVKIYHAYENDVKWIHEDFDLQPTDHRNRNVIDTSKLYNLCNRVKKGVSIGLRTLAKQYVNFSMDKNFQRSDWRIRPLFKQMVQYAAIDAEILPYVYLRMLSESDPQSRQRFIETFSYKHNMKSRATRNRLIKKGKTEQKEANKK